MSGKNGIAPAAPDVQLENGYLRIATELIEAFALYRFNGGESSVVFAMFRATFGWNKKSAPVSLRDLARATGRHESKVQQDVASLVQQNVLIVTKEATFCSPRELAVNKVYTEWKHWELVNPLGPSESTKRGVSESARATVSESANPSIKTIKDNLKTKVRVSENQVSHAILENPEILKAWNEWLAYRRERKVKTTQSTMQKQLDFLAKQLDAVACIEQSIRNGWQGLFPATVNRTNGAAAADTGYTQFKPSEVPS